MKSLLVRYFNKNSGKMVEAVNYQNLTGIYECIMQQISFDMNLPLIPYDHESEGLIFMQCTGKEDKNGKLIYDGDIIREKYTDPDTGEAYQNFRIEKDEKFCCFSQIAIGYDYREGFPEYDFKEENVEVIGNIWQTPELLKGEG